MKTFRMASLCLVVSLSASCVHQQVTESVEEHTVIEGQRYAREVEAQSPFETVEISWREAGELMKERNPKYIAAQNGYEQAVAHTPMVMELSDQVKSVVDLSFEDILKPDKLAQSLQAPITQLPKQLASISKLKDMSHEIEQNTWEKTSDSVEAEFKMREEKVKLHRLLRTGELIDGEMGKLNSAPPLPPEADPKLLAARNAWQGNLKQSREDWLDQVRDFFDAEFHDVHFKKDGSGLPTYQDMDHPDLSEWQRWCRLTRSQELVTVLQEAHDESKPAIPGSKMVTESLAEFLHLDGDGQPDAQRKTASVRSEVRTLIRSWREMKEAQEKAERLDASDSERLDSLVSVNQRQTVFKLRKQEIQYASVVWLMDEKCWN